MSNTNFSCRNKYYNYGSYLRSRGYDKEICNLVTDIEAGKINIGPINPGNCPSVPTTINNNVTINSCTYPNNPVSGILKVNGGDLGLSNIINDASNGASFFLNQSINYGIQSTQGNRILGPIVQVSDCDHYNYFGSKYHIFNGGIDMVTGGDCSTNVLVRGNLLVDGSTVELGGYFGETLELITFPSKDETTFKIYRSPESSGNIVEYYNDISSNIVNWEKDMAYAIDGNSGAGGQSNGSTNVQGHVRSFRGITVSNPPIYNQSIDICYNTDICGSSVALDVYGDILINPGNNGSSGNIDLSGGGIYLSNNSYILSNGDASFNGHLTVTDLSVINVLTVGTSTSYIDTSNVITNITDTDELYVNNYASIFDLSVSNLLTIGSDTIISSDTITTDLFIGDISSNTINDISYAIALLDTSVNSLEYSVSVLDTSINGIDASINSIEASLTILNGSVSALELAVNSLESSVAVLDTSVNALESSVTVLDASVNSIEDSITVLDVSVNALEFSVNALVSSVAVLDTSVNALESSVTVLDDSVNSIEASIAVLDASVNSIEDSITVLDVSVNALEYSVDVLDVSVNALESSVTVLDVSVNALEFSIAVLDTSVNVLESSATVLHASVNTLESSVIVLDASVNALESSVTVLDASVNALESSVTVLDDSVNVLESSVTVLDASVNVLESSVTVLDASVNALESSVTVLDSSVNSIEASITVLDTSVNALESSVAVLDVSVNGVEVIISNYDISFNSISINGINGKFENLDISENVSFIKNPIINNPQRTLTNFGETMTIINLDSSGSYNNGQYDISFEKVIYSNVDNSSNIFNTTTNIIDFSNNQNIIGNSIWEIYFSIPCEFNNQAESFAVSFKDVNGSTELILDTRSVGKKDGFKTVVFGPQTFLFQQDSPDILYSQMQWNVNFDICGGSIETKNGRLTMKQKSLI